jgi:hypothetical protein
MSIGRADVKQAPKTSAVQGTHHTPTGGREKLSPEIGAMAQPQMIGATQPQSTKRPPGG